VYLSNRWIPVYPRRFPVSARSLSAARQSTHGHLSEGPLRAERENRAAAVAAPHDPAGGPCRIHFFHLFSPLNGVPFSRLAALPGFRQHGDRRPQGAPRSDFRFRGVDGMSVRRGEIGNDGGEGAGAGKEVREPCVHPVLLRHKQKPDASMVQHRPLRQSRQGRGTLSPTARAIAGNPVDPFHSPFLPRLWRLFARGMQPVRVPGKIPSYGTGSERPDI
jgi:hypothetical protein